MEMPAAAPNLATAQSVAKMSEETNLGAPPMTGMLELTLSRFT
jgi:hypothetical protein